MAAVRQEVQTMAVVLAAWPVVQMAGPSLQPQCQQLSSQAGTTKDKKSRLASATFTLRLVVTPRAGEKLEDHGPPLAAGTHWPAAPRSHLPWGAAHPV